jgi:hypothetical protein
MFNTLTTYLKMLLAGNACWSGAASISAFLTSPSLPLLLSLTVASDIFLHSTPLPLFSMTTPFLFSCLLSNHYQSPCCHRIACYALIENPWPQAVLLQALHQRNAVAMKQQVDSVRSTVKMSTQKTGLKPYIMGHGLKVPGANIPRRHRVKKTLFAIDGISELLTVVAMTQ